MSLTPDDGADDGRASDASASGASPWTSDNYLLGARYPGGYVPAAQDPAATAAGVLPTTIDPALTAPVGTLTRDPAAGQADDRGANGPSADDGSAGEAAQPWTSDKYLLSPRYPSGSAPAGQDPAAAAAGVLPTTIDRTLTVPTGTLTRDHVIGQAADMLGALPREQFAQLLGPTVGFVSDLPDDEAGLRDGLGRMRARLRGAGSGDAADGAPDPSVVNVGGAAWSRMLDRAEADWSAGRPPSDVPREVGLAPARAGAEVVDDRVGGARTGDVATTSAIDVGSSALRPEVQVGALARAAGDAGDLKVGAALGPATSGEASQHSAARLVQRSFKRKAATSAALDKRSVAEAEIPEVIRKKYFSDRVASPDQMRLPKGGQPTYDDASGPWRNILGDLRDRARGVLDAELHGPGDFWNDYKAELYRSLRGLEHASTTTPDLLSWAEGSVPEGVLRAPSVLNALGDVLTTPIQGGIDSTFGRLGNRLSNGGAPVTAESDILRPFLPMVFGDELLSGSPEKIPSLEPKYKTIEEIHDAVADRYQRSHDYHYENIMKLADQWVFPMDRTILGQHLDRMVKSDLRAWLKANGIKEGRGEAVQIDRKLYDPAGSGDYCIPDVYFKDLNAILDGSIALKTSKTSQIRKFKKFTGGARVTIIRPNSVRPGVAGVGSYGIYP